MSEVLARGVWGCTGLSQLVEIKKRGLVTEGKSRLSGKDKSQHMDIKAEKNRRSQQKKGGKKDRETYGRKHRGNNIRKAGFGE